MNWTLTDIQNQIANEIDQSSTAPTTGGTDWNIRVNAINRSLLDWQETYDWRGLLKIHNGRISTSTGNASYALPADFRKIDGYPIIVDDGSTAHAYAIIDTSKRDQYIDTDRYVMILGNDRDTNVMYIHGATLASGASVEFSYYKGVTTVSAVTDVSECPDPTFIVQRSLYYLYKAREDGRFPEAKAESDKILARMVESENSLGYAHTDQAVATILATKYGFRVGRD